MEDLFMKSSAVFSDCRKYRYALWRVWDSFKPTCMFIGLNPSTANENDDDPTIRRVKGFARKWGYGGVYMMNCFPIVTPDPMQIVVDDRVLLNDIWLLEKAHLCELIIFAWGSFDIVKQYHRDEDMKALFPEAKALGINQDGSPRHPLYIPGKMKPINFQNPQPV